MADLYPGRPLNMNPEDYARQIAAGQAAYIAELERQMAGNERRQTVLEYSFSASTAEPPTTGQMRTDAAGSAITKVWAHKTTSTGIDIANVATLFHNGDRCYIQTKNDGTCNAQLRLRGEPVFKSTYIEFPVSFVEGGAALKGGQVAILALTPLT